MTQLKIKKAFADLIPPLSVEERGELENSIRTNGCRDAICVWNGTIVDGHNRYDICKRSGRAFRVKEMDFASEAEAVEWIIKNQLGRRNLNAAQRATLALRLKDAVAARAKERQRDAGKEHGRGQSKKVSQKSDEPIPARTDAELAKSAGVSRDTIRKVEKVAAAATPEVKTAMLSGNMSVNAAYKTVAASKPKPPTHAPAPAPCAPDPVPVASAADGDENPSLTVKVTLYGAVKELVEQRAEIVGGYAEAVIALLEKLL